MVWSISITNEGWNEIREALEEKSKNWLIKALVADSMEKMEMVAMKKSPMQNKRQRLENLSARYRQAYYIHSYRAYLGDKESLVDECLQRMEENDSCENGGFEYWIDKEGYYSVRI